MTAKRKDKREQPRGKPEQPKVTKETLKDLDARESDKAKVAGGATKMTPWCSL